MSESGGSTFRPRGIHAALVTPFRSDETLDEDRLASHLEFVLASGVTGVVAIGGCGEYLNLDDHERLRVVQRTLQIVNGRVPVIAGALGPSTREVLEVGCAGRPVGPPRRPLLSMTDQQPKDAVALLAQMGDIR